MRLLNTQTLQFYETYQPRQERYMILSHRWSNEEITYQDFVLTQQSESLLSRLQAQKEREIRSRSGYLKIVRFCQLAREHEYQWCWVDTCCIDKTSSAELSEAINSMWAWYEHAETCCVYLADVASGNEWEAFGESEWFQRSWTLQELLAPPALVFCNQNWDLFFSLAKSECKWTESVQCVLNEFVRRDLLLLQVIARATNVDEKAVTSTKAAKACCVAQKLSWAAFRIATRDEDIAYSLLGLFDINMPLLYGEGMRAFQRLQLEILRTSTDESILAWRNLHCIRSRAAPDADSLWPCLRSCRFPSVLAPRPTFFAGSGRIIAAAARDTDFMPRDPPYTITNQGLSIVFDSSAMILFNEKTQTVYYLLELRCFERTEQGSEKPCTILLEDLGPSTRRIDRTKNIRRRACTCDLGDKVYALGPQRTDFLNDMTLYLPLRADAQEISALTQAMRDVPDEELGYLADALFGNFRAS